MFGKPQWFKAKSWGWGIHPVTWQGWGWLAGWLTVMLAPYVAFLSYQMWTEGFIWLGAMVAALFLDVWQVLNALQPPAAANSTATVRYAPKAPPPAVESKRAMPDDGILFLGDPAPTGRGVGTKNYDFQVRK